MTHKHISIFTILSSIALLCSSCTDDVVTAGSQALGEGEEVIVESDTLRNITSSLSLAQSIYTTPDSFLLGECELRSYGTFQADILTQFACPVGFEYPEGAELDSVCLYLYFRTYAGKGTSPLGIRVYEMDGEPLDYYAEYASDVPLEPYCSMKKIVSREDKIVVPDHITDSIYSSANSCYYRAICIPLSQEFAERLFAIRDFSSQALFNQLFKGLYITSCYGSSTCLYLTDISIGIHYHYTYNDPSSATLVVNEDTKALYANSEVRQINRYAYPDLKHLFPELALDPLYNYIASPAGVYTHIHIPLKGIKDKIVTGVKGKRPYVNMSRLRIDVLNAEDKADGLDFLSPSTSMLLIKEDAYQRFFYADEDILSDTCAMLSTLTYETDSMDIDHYYYTFSMNSLLNEYLRGNTGFGDTLTMMLIPVDVIYTTNSNGTSIISDVLLKQSLTNTIILSPSNDISPLDIEIVYSGFGDVTL